MAPAKKSPRKSAVADHPLLQWIMAGIGLVITLAAAGIIVHAALQPPSPPDLTARVTDTRRAAQGFVAEVQVANLGRDAAAAVQVEGRSGAETASATVDYVAGGGRVTVTVAFPGDPAPVEARVTGWSRP